MLHAVIMAGGSGTRFWPASRRQRPKQLLSLIGDEPLIRTTVLRILPLVPAENVWVVTTEATAELTRSILPELPADNVLIEPVGRDTAAKHRDSAGPWRPAPSWFAATAACSPLVSVPPGPKPASAICRLGSITAPLTSGRSTGSLGL